MNTITSNKTPRPSGNCACGADCQCCCSSGQESTSRSGIIQDMTFDLYSLCHRALSRCQAVMIVLGLVCAFLIMDRFLI